MLTRISSSPSARVGGAVAGLALVLTLACGKEGGVADRSLPARDYACLFRAGNESFSVKEGETFNVPLEVRNAGRAAWSSTATPPCLLSFHLLDGRKNILRRDNARYPLPRPIKPGESFSAAVPVKAPLRPGRYYLEFDLVREGAHWFKDLGSRTVLVKLTVAPHVWPDDRYALNLQAGPFTRLESSRPECGQLLELIRITLDHDETSFKGITGKVTGFAGGGSYPQVWLRDANTVIPASRFFYGRDHLGSWLLEHLARQKSDGGLEDWVDSAGRSGKNTTETDQEASAVQAAAQVCRLEGTAWLGDRVLGRPVIDRLEQALNYVLADRYDERTGLVRSSHTIDWGDVDIEDADERAVTADERTHWVAGIYSQSMFYGAARDLAWMFERLGQKEKSLFWTVRAQSLRERANARLWQNDKGFYRVHIHLDASLPHSFPEEAMFAMGGNVMAILSGLADETKATLILRQALARQKTYRLSTISGVLLPPYPGGTFKHPQVDQPYEYQNGGQWDWFGGLLILALYQNGFSRQATDKLAEVTAKDMANGGLYEWDDPQGNGRGSDFYGGSAGSLARALFEGYFGLNLTAEALSLEPRLGTDRAIIHASLRGSGLFVAYDYRFNPDGRSLTLRYNSNVPGPGRVRVRLPWPIGTPDSLQPTSADYEVTLDGRPVPFSLSRVNEDEYVVLQTDFRDHRLVIRPSTPGQARSGR